MSTRIPGIRALFRLPASQGRVASEVEDEIAFHIEERTRVLVARGMDPAAARDAALREFGDVGAARAELVEIDRRRVRQVRRASWWDELRQDVRYAWRALRRSPAFTTVAVLTLALGIGATTAIYTVVDSVLLRPVGVADPERVVVLWEHRRGSEREFNVVSPANFAVWQKQSTSFASMTWFTTWPLNLTGDGEPQQVQAQLVTPAFFTTLGVQPMLGRGFVPDDAPAGSAETAIGNAVVLSHALWQGRYGGDPTIVGRTVQVQDQPRTVVGVMPPDFRVLGRSADVWMPMWVTEDRMRVGRFVTGIGRLKPGATMERASEELATIARRLEAAYPEKNTNWTTRLVPIREQVVGEVRPALLVLLGAVGMLLLIACTNVANLLLGRATARRREIVMRLSLGATRMRVVRQLLTESVVLAVAGGAIGIAAALLGTRALLRSLPPSLQLPGLDGITVDARVLAVALGLTLLTALLFGLAPALAATRVDLQGALRDGSRGTIGGRGALRLRSALVVAEVALALMLLVGAGLLMRSFQKLQAVDTGMRAENVLTLRMGLESALYDSAEARRGFMARMLPALKGLPGVEAVGTIWFLPLTGEISGSSGWRADRPRPKPDDEMPANIRVVGGDYFAAQGIRLVRGRTFDARDHATAPMALVINEELARQNYPGEDPIGKRFVYDWDGDQEGEIVGVVADVRDLTLTDPPAPAVYRPFTQWPAPRIHVIVRTNADPMAIAGAARERIRALDPNLPVANVRTMESVVDEASARPRMNSYLLGAFATFALLLAALGLYGIISYGVAQRRDEIGVRVALGAARGDILRLIVRQGLGLTVAGLAIGLVGALALSRVLRSLLFGVSATDAMTFVVVPLVLVGVALLASWLPASRAARLDPAVALRGQ